MKFIAFVLQVFAVVFLSQDVQAAGVPITYVRNVYTVTPVTTSAYVTMVSALGSTAKHMSITDTSGQVLIISWAASCGALSSASNTIIIPANATGMVGFDAAIIQGSCIGVKALSASATTGELDITIYQ